MKKYSEKQLEVHGELILQHIKDPNLRWKFRKNCHSPWIMIDEGGTPGFWVQFDYEIVEPIWQNERGEVVYEGQEVFWFDCIKGEVESCKANHEMSMKETFNTTRVATSKRVALKLGREKLVEYFNKQFQPAELITDVKTLQENLWKAVEDLRRASPMHEVTVDISVCRHG